MTSRSGEFAWLAAVARAVFTFDRSSVELGFVLRATLGVALPLIIATALGHPALGFSVAVGALVSGASSLQGVYRSRIAIVLGVGAGMAIAAYFGALAATSVPLLLVLTAAIGYGWGMVAQFGMPARVAALNTTVAFIIFSSLPLGPEQDAIQSLLLFAGAAFQALLLLISWPLDRSTIERRALAGVFRDVAAVASAVGKPAEAFPPIASFGRARLILNDTQPLASSRSVARLKRLLADAETLRSRLGALIAVTEPDVVPQTRAFADAVAQRARQIAATLERGAGTDVGLVADDVDTAICAYEAACGTRHPLTISVARDIVSALRDAGRAAAVIASRRPARVLFSAMPRPREYVETHLKPINRDAIRITLILCVAMVLSHTFFSSERGYWIALTAALVLRPDLHSTLVRGAARMIGTLAGAVFATLAAAATHGRADAQAAVMIAASALAYLTLVPNYAAFSAVITVFVVVALELLGTGGHATVYERVIDTLIGGTLAMAGYIALPSWGVRRTRPLLADLIDAQRTFAHLLLQAYSDPAQCDMDAIASIRTRCWKLRTETEAALDRSRLEPKRPHTIAIDDATRALAATQRFALTNMALEAGLTHAGSFSVPATLRPFAAVLDATLERLADAVRSGHPHHESEDLAAARAALAADIEQYPSARFVIESAADYVRATHQLEELTRL